MHVIVCILKFNFFNSYTNDVADHYTAKFFVYSKNQANSNIKIYDIAKTTRAKQYRHSMVLIVA